MMKKAAIILMAVVFLFSLSNPVFAADTDNHTVTVTVAAINEVAITGGAITLTIDTATAGGEPTNATDATCTLDWTTNELTKKITVETTVGVPPQNFTLQVQATGVTGGTSGGLLTLTHAAAAQDFVTGVSQTIGDCTLSYTASATAAQGTGTDTHTVVYTITNG